MPFVKVVKNNAYHKRFQVKFRRRRECKTDYQARKALVLQDKNKYNSPKYRLVVRFSNKDVTCQIAYATIRSDVILCAAYSHELSKYGANLYKTTGQKNYAASYATGLLAARRVLTKLGMDKQYVGQTKPDGKNFLVKKGESDRRPFLVLLDVGLHFTTTGSRVFGVMKGAVDGGLEIPHKNKRFPGYNHSAGKFDPAVLRKYIFGGHVADYQKKLQAENPEKYKQQFPKYIAAGVGPDGVEKMWATVHENIRKDPTFTKVVRNKEPKKVKNHRKKLNAAQRKNRVKQRLTHAQKMTQ
jgi:large subunit ribosomal protein L5e